MKTKYSVLSGLLVSLLLISNLAQAHPPGHRGGGWRGSVGVYVGSPFPFYGPPAPFAYSYGYPYYAYPYAYSPPQVIVTQPPQPQVYIEQGSGVTSTPDVSSQPPAQATAPTASAGNNAAQGYWYYCEQSDSYYPYVKECAAGWKQVTPTPPSTPGR